MSPLEKFDPPETGDFTPPTAGRGLDGDLPGGGSEARQCVGRYRLIRLLGRGGMGAVYLAHDTHLDRDVALKVPHFSAQQGELMQRFFREARAAGRLQHPNICPVFDVGEADGVYYLSMAFIDGEPLSARVKDYACRPPKEAAALVRLLALALEEAHAQGVVHRDLKPSNIMLNRRGEPVVMDFGLAREVHNAANQTQAGMVLGTPAYMSPEQARGDVAAVGPGCDIYSLGVVLYELLTGRVPFQGHSLDVLAQHLRDEPPLPSTLRPELDVHIESICLKAMAKEPSQRFLRMADFAQSLAEYAAGGGAGPELIPEIDPLGSIAAESLVLLRTWGWEAGVGKLKTSLGKRENPPEAWLLLDWLRGDSVPADMLARFRGLRQYPALAGWALLGRGWQANREHQFDRTEGLLREAAASGDPRDNVLHAAVAHQRGFWLYQEGRLAEALHSLHQALGLCGHDHFLTADVLGTLGLVYANKNNFQAASELIQQALLAHRRFDNDRVVARLLRHQGEIYLDWGYLDRAEEVFQHGLELGVKRQDERVQAIMFHYLGRVAIARGQQSAQAGKRSARQEFGRARQWLDAAIAAQQAAGRSNAEAAALRERALLAVEEGDHEAARTHAARAEELFGESGHEEGMARIREVQGMLARRLGEHGQAQRLLRQALAHFDRVADYLEGTRAQLEIARALADAGALPQVVCAAYLDALHRAESCRRTYLVRAIEEELQAIDREAYWRHIVGRTRGRAAMIDTSSLADGSSEAASVLFLNLRQFHPFCQGMEPEEVMQTLNHMMADLGEPLRKAEAQVTAYLGGGFMALLRGPGHAWRAVDVALELIAVVEEFNRPRAVLGLQQLPVRIGVSSGPVYLGNIGTYQKMDFTAVGHAVNLASRLVRQGETSLPCISRETRELVGDRFRYAPGSPRTLDLGTLGRHEVYDVVGRKQGLLGRAEQ
jgi:serine/threonine protein kinase/class 3 adenylate cyclase/tetratricopeptide (TPR) repeat protein